MDIKDVKLLIKMVTETDITEFEMEGGEERIYIKRGSEPQVVHYQSPAPVYAAPSAAPAAPAQAAAAPAAPAAAKTDDVKGDRITSPIVGTFYRSPAPDAPPYAEVGQVVEKGQVFCIVEAMKLMNEIEAEFRCKIVKICKENAEPVEFGETLFIVERL
jgi:acetyl-CoA carboxylase biotin carboxyl carrier protein